MLLSHPVSLRRLSHPSQRLPPPHHRQWPTTACIAAAPTSCPLPSKSSTRSKEIRERIGRTKRESQKKNTWKGSIVLQAPLCLPAGTAALQHTSQWVQVQLPHVPEPSRDSVLFYSWESSTHEFWSIKKKQVAQTEGAERKGSHNNIHIDVRAGNILLWLPISLFLDPSFRYYLKIPLFFRNNSLVDEEKKALSAAYAFLDKMKWSLLYSVFPRLLIIWSTKLSFGVNRGSSAFWFSFPRWSCCRGFFGHW